MMITAIIFGTVTEKGFFVVLNIYTNYSYLAIQTYSALLPATITIKIGEQIGIKLELDHLVIFPRTPSQKTLIT